MARKQPVSPFRVNLTAEARDDLRKLPGHAPQFIKKIQTVAEQPNRGHPLRQGLRHDRALNLTGGQRGYRAVYHVFAPVRTVVVYAIGPHKTVYDTAQKRHPAPAPDSASQGAT